MQIPRTSVQAKSHRFKNLAVLIYLMVSAGMGLMFVSIFLGLPVWASMAALIGPMLLIVGLTSGKTEYTIDGLFLEKKLITFLRKKHIDKKYTWNDIHSFKEGKDMNRSYEEYRYIEIYFKDWTTWQITDQVDKPGFQNFEAVFLEAVKAHNQPSATATNSTAGSYTYTAEAHTVSAEAKAVKTNGANHQIIQRKSFYETVWAHVFFWAMALLVSGIAGFLVLNPGYLTGSIAFKLSVVVIPGMGYMYYRLFVKKK